MKKINLTELSSEELLKEAKNNRKSTFILSFISVIIMSVVAIITIIDKDIKVLTVMSLAFSGIAIMIWQQHQSVEKEIELRKLK